VIVLPNKKTGLALAEEKLLATPISKLLERAENENINLFLPKFKIETTLDLEKALGKVRNLSHCKYLFLWFKIQILQIGLKQLFSVSADFSGITDKGALIISDVVQKAFIEVNEEGTTAAAVTCGINTIFYLLDLFYKL
jgi:serpin B